MPNQPNTYTEPAATFIHWYENDVLKTAKAIEKEHKESMQRKKLIQQTEESVSFGVPGPTFGDFSPNVHITNSDIIPNLSPLIIPLPLEGDNWVTKLTPALISHLKDFRKHGKLGQFFVLDEREDQKAGPRICIFHRKEMDGVVEPKILLESLNQVAKWLDDANYAHVWAPLVLLGWVKPGDSAEWVVKIVAEAFKDAKCHVYATRRCLFTGEARNETADEHHVKQTVEPIPEDPQTEPLGLDWDAVQSIREYVELFGRSTGLAVVSAARRIFDELYDFYRRERNGPFGRQVYPEGRLEQMFNRLRDNPPDVRVSVRNTMYVDIASHAMRILRRNIPYPMRPPVTASEIEAANLSERRARRRESAERDIRRAMSARSRNASEFGLGQAIQPIVQEAQENPNLMRDYAAACGIDIGATADAAQAPQAIGQPRRGEPPF